MTHQDPTAITGRSGPSASRLSRSLLCGTTALVGTGLAAGPAEAQEEIQLEVTGFLNNFYGISDVDEAGAQEFSEFATHFDGEIHFAGSTVLENGLEVGVQFEIEVPDPTVLDENYLFIEGNFGQARFGGDNTAMYQMGLGTFSAGGVGVPINSGWISDFVPEPEGFTNAFRSPAMSTAIDITNDDNTLTYFTPRVAGFQFGASFVPRASFRGTPTNGIVDENAPFESADDRYRNGFSFGGNYVSEFAGVDVGVSGGYAQAFANDAVEAVGGDDIQQVMVGGMVGFAGWTLDASYANELEGRFDGTAAAPISTEGEALNVGLTYAIAAWQFSGSYLHGEVESDITIPGEDELDAAALSVSYALGPGIDVAGTVLYANWDEETLGEQDGFSFASGFALTF